MVTAAIAYLAIGAISLRAWPSGDRRKRPLVKVIFWPLFGLGLVGAIVLQKMEDSVS